MYDIVLFDLDGTLTDSAPGIVNGFQYALCRFGLPEVDPDEIRAFIGGPVVENCVHYGVPAERAEEFIAEFRVYYNKDGIFENAVYSGVVEMLGQLRDSGIRMAIATSKPLRAARIVLDHFALACFFETVVGSGPEGEVMKKDAGIRLVLDRMGVDPGQRVAMIGDRSYDMLGATANSADGIGILHGYGASEELRASGAKYIVEAASEIPPIILGRTNDA